MIEEPKYSPVSPREPLSFGSGSESANPAPVDPERMPAGSDPASPDVTSKLSMRTQLQSAFDGTYRIGEMIDRGQCSTTFLALAATASERVALKVLQLDPVVDPALADRVARQVRASQDIAAECHLVPSRFEQRGSFAVIVMPYMSGGSVASLLRNSAPPSVSRVNEIVDAVAASLDCAHARGVLHLGLTPENIFFDARERPSISDFGISNIVLTAHSVHGTRSARAGAYAAPEQRRKQKVDGRADQFALAVIAYELLTGHLRLEKESVQGISTIEPIEVLADVPLRSGLPLYVNAALRRALSAGAANRFASVTQFANALAGRALGSIDSLPTTRAQLHLHRKRRAAAIFGIATAIFVIATIVDPRLKVAVRHGWQYVAEHLSGTTRRVDVTTDLSSASSIAPDVVTRGPTSTRAGNPASVAHVTHGDAPSLASPSNAHDSPADSTAGGGVTHVQVGSPTSSDKGVGNVPAVTTTLSAGKAALRDARLWITRTLLGGSSASSSSELAYVRISVNRGTTMVIIDGIPRGSAPLTASVQPGHHTVAVYGSLDYGGSPAGVNASAGDTVGLTFVSVSKP
ncbi:MAG TPA: serine/threonine-protein kinase [Gemmatimonadaceae bacterium]|nr:serine/threonine-protein kinase [Gemmatimonadaceae bacterium]